MVKKTRVVEPSLLILHVLYGYCDDFELLLDRVREFIRQREGPAGPWLYEPAEYGGLSLWQWVAAIGCKNSCRDMQILSHFLDLVFAYDPVRRRVAVAPFGPGMRSVHCAESVLGSQVFSFVAAHLTDPASQKLVRGRPFEREDSSVNYCDDRLVREGGGLALDYRGIGAFAMLDFDDDGDLDDDVVMFDLVPPAEFDYISDWLNLIVYEPHVRDQGRYSPPRDTGSLNARLDAVHDVVLETHRREAAPEFAMAVDAVLARAIQRTNSLRRRYRRLAEKWPEVPPMRLPYSSAAISVCLSTPELARIAGVASCDGCDGCTALEDDLIRDRQLRLKV